MKSINDNRKDQCLNDVQKYEKWERLLESRGQVHDSLKRNDKNHKKMVNFANKI